MTGMAAVADLFQGCPTTAMVAGTVVSVTSAARGMRAVRYMTATTETAAALYFIATDAMLAVPAMTAATGMIALNAMAADALVARLAKLGMGCRSCVRAAPGRLGTWRK